MGKGKHKDALKSAPHTISCKLHSPLQQAAMGRGFPGAENIPYVASKCPCKWQLGLLPVT